MDPDRARTHAVLDAVGRTSLRVEALLGENPIVCIVYGGPKGEAMLLSRHGQVLFAFEDWDDPEFACEQAYFYLENQLWLLLHGY